MHVGIEWTVHRTVYTGHPKVDSLVDIVVVKVKGLLMLRLRGN